MNYVSHRVHFSEDAKVTMCGVEHYIAYELMRVTNNEALVTCCNCTRRMLAHKRNPFIQSANGKREKDRIRNRELRKLRKGN